MTLDLTKELLVEMEEKNAIKARERWIQQINRMTLSEVLEFQRGLDRLLLVSRDTPMEKSLKK